MSSLIPGSPPSDGNPAPGLPTRGTTGVLAPAAATGSEEKVDLTRVLSALRRFRWLILGSALAGLAGGILATRYLEPQYEVGATIFIETPASANQGGTPIQGEELLLAEAWVELLRTYKVLDPVVRERRLYLSAAQGSDSVLFRGFDLANSFLPGGFEYSVSRDGRSYTLRHRRSALTETGSVGDSVGRTVGFLWVPQPGPHHFDRKVRFQVIRPREASNQLSGRLVSTLREKNFLSLRLTGPNPEQAAATMNALITRYVEEAAAQKREKLTLLARVLDSQVVEQANRLRSAEERLEGFKVGTVTLPREDVPVAAGLQLTQPTVYSRYFTMRTDLDAMRRDRRAVEDVLDRSLRAELAVDAFNTIAAVRNAPDFQRVLGEISTTEAELRTLLGTYTTEHPQVKDLQDRIATLRDRTIPMYARALIQQLRNQEDELETRIARAGQELRSIPSRVQTEARLDREVKQADQLYRSLAINQAEARLAEASSIPDVRILDYAIPPTRPSKNQAVRLIFLGLAAGLGLGLGLALLLDRIDKRFRYPDQVSLGLGLPILGTIPQIRRGGLAASSPEWAAQMVESFRSVRLNLAHSFEPGQPISFTISSPSPGDGKSLIASNLALSFAEAGYRTLLVDGDIRRGLLHRTFQVDRNPGLLDYLSNGTEMTSVLWKTSHANLTVLPTGSRRREGPELLGTDRMRELIQRLRGQFDVIVVDTPPLGAGIDPFVLSTMTGSLALVLRAGETDRQLAEAKLQILDRLPVRLLGAVLNDVRVGEGAYRYYAYSYGYEVTDEAGNSVLPSSR